MLNLVTRVPKCIRSLRSEPLSILASRAGDLRPGFYRYDIALLHAIREASTTTVNHSLAGYEPIAGGADQLGVPRLFSFALNTTISPYSNRSDLMYLIDVFTDALGGLSWSLQCHGQSTQLWAYSFKCGVQTAVHSLCTQEHASLSEDGCTQLPPTSRQQQQIYAARATLTALVLAVERATPVHILV